MNGLNGDWCLDFLLIYGCIDGLNQGCSAAMLHIWRFLHSFTALPLYGSLARTSEKNIIANIHSIIVKFCDIIATLKKNCDIIIMNNRDIITNIHGNLA